MQPPRFTLRVLGGFRLEHSGVLVEIPNRKLACLLTFLACVAPAPQSRERLASLLWEVHGDERARHNLRQAFSALRRLLGAEAIVNAGEGVRLAAGAMACDAVEFEVLLASGDDASISAAAEIYQGALLEGVGVGGAAWNEWLLRERQRLKERAVGAIVAQGEGRLAAGDADGAIACGRRAAGFDNFREDAHRLVLKGLVAAGRNAEALRHYQDLASFLKSELNVQPDSETSRLAAATGRVRADSASVAEPAPIAAPAAAARQGDAERRHVTLLVCNVSPVRPTNLDPEDLRDPASHLRRTAADIAARFGGAVLSRLGHSVHLCFGYPEARERDAIQAVRAGMAIVQACQGEALPVRIGVASGLVVVEQTAGPDGGLQPLVIGAAPAIALQLQAHAAPGEVIVSRETRLLLEQAFDLRPVEVAYPRGASERLEGWLVAGEASGSAPPSALVGRQEEVDLLLRRWRETKGGQGCVVLLSGEPGIGKTRLAEQLLLEVAEDRPAQLRYFSSPHQAMRPFHPYIEQIEKRAGVSSANAPAENLRRIAALLEGASADVARDVALIADLLTLAPDALYPAPSEGPQQKRDLLMAIFLDQLAGLAARQPVVAVFEDLHWFDPTSLDLLDRTIARIDQLPVLVIATFRPEHQPAWIDQPHVTLMRLNRLGRRNSAAIVEEVAGELPHSLVDQILDRADGVPLFVRELSRHVLEGGWLDEAAEGPAATAALPTRLRAVLGARLQRLGPARRVALVGSVIGRRFSRGLIAAVVEEDELDLDEALGRLTASGLISPRGTRPDDSFEFAHVLVRDTAYDLTLKDERRRLHAKAADVLIDRFSADAEGSPEIVAHHLSQAGRAGEAADYWVRAARAAHVRWANRESADLFERALREVDRLPKTAESMRTAIDLRFEIKNCLTPIGEFDRIIERLREAEGLLSEFDDPQRLCQLHVHLCQTLGFSGNSDDAVTTGQRAERLAQSFNDPRLLIEASLFLGTAHFAIMDYQAAERLFVRVLQLLEEAPGDGKFALAGYPGISAGAYLAKICTELGEFDRGVAYGEAAVRQAEDIAQPYSLSLSLWCLANLHLSRGEITRAVELFERGLAISMRWDLPFLIAGHSGALGYAYVFAGREDEGLPLLEQAMAVFEGMRHELGLMLFLVPLGEAYVMAGRLDQAGDLARRVLDLALKNGRRSGQVGPLRILADIAARSGRLDEAEDRYREALRLAEDLGMRPLAARCRHGLANIGARKSDQKRAREERAAASAMYRDMGMGFWLGRLEAAS